MSDNKNISEQQEYQEYVEYMQHVQSLQAAQSKAQQAASPQPFQPAQNQDKVKLAQGKIGSDMASRVPQGIKDAVSNAAGMMTGRIKGATLGNFDPGQYFGTSDTAGSAVGSVLGEATTLGIGGSQAGMALGAKLGAKTLAGSGIGALLGGAQKPVGDDTVMHRLENAAVGGVVGAASPYVGSAYKGLISGLGRGGKVAAAVAQEIPGVKTVVNMVNKGAEAWKASAPAAQEVAAEVNPMLKNGSSKMTLEELLKGSTSK